MQTSNNVRFQDFICLYLIGCESKCLYSRSTLALLQEDGTGVDVHPPCLRHIKRCISIRVQRTE